MNLHRNPLVRPRALASLVSRPAQMSAAAWVAVKASRSGAACAASERAADEASSEWRSLDMVCLRGSAGRFA